MNDEQQSQTSNREKEDQKIELQKKVSAESMKVRCKTCFKETAPTRQCNGHDGGSDSAAGGDASDDSLDTPNDKEKTPDDDLLTASIEESELNAELVNELTLDEKENNQNPQFDPEIIEQLILNDDLMVKLDRQSQTLTITLDCDPHDLTPTERDELNKFIEAVAKEFNDFKEEKDLSDCSLQTSQDDMGNKHSLSIKMPTLELYDEFIQRLSNELIPTPKPTLKKQDDSTAEAQTASEAKVQDITINAFNPSPFRMENTRD